MRETIIIILVIIVYIFEKLCTPLNCGIEGASQSHFMSITFVYSIVNIFCRFDVLTKKLLLLALFDATIFNLISCGGFGVGSRTGLTNTTPPPLPSVNNFTSFWIHIRYVFRWKLFIQSISYHLLHITM